MERKKSRGIHFLSLLLCLALAGAGPVHAAEEISYLGFQDPTLKEDLEEALVEAFEEMEGMEITGIDTVYISKEYLEERAYNSKVNVYFGYTAEELDKEFAGQDYVFTLGENGDTVPEVVIKEGATDAFSEFINNFPVEKGIFLITFVVKHSAWIPGLNTVLDPDLEPALRVVVAVATDTVKDVVVSRNLLVSLAKALSRNSKDIEEVVRDFVPEIPEGSEVVFKVLAQVAETG